MGAGSDARSYVGGNTLPLSVVLLGERLELDAAPGQDIVLASAGLPDLGRDHAHTGPDVPQSHTSRLNHLVAVFKTRGTQTRRLDCDAYDLRKIQQHQRWNLIPPIFHFYY